MTEDCRPADRITLGVSNMSCDSCVSTVTKVLSKVPGVTRVEVDLDQAKAEIDGSARPDALIASLERAGFEAHLRAPS